MGCRRMLGVEDRAAIMAGVNVGLSKTRIAHLIGRSPRWCVVRSPAIWALTGSTGPRRLARQPARPGVARRSACWIVMRSSPPSDL